MLQYVQKYLICFLIAFLSIPTFGQDSPPSDKESMPLNVKASYNLGFMLAHRNKMKHIPKELTQGFELSVERRGTNKKAWEQLYNNPTVGVAMLVTSTGNQDLLGTAIGLNGYILIPLVKRERIQLETSWGWGLGYVTKVFDPLENHRNNTIGSHLNLFAAIKLMAQVKLSQHLNANLGASFHHWSNSSLKYPNLGLNIPSLNVGLLYRFGEVQNFSKLSKAERKAKFPVEEKNEYSVIASIGMKSRDSHDPDLYAAYTLAFNYARLWSQKYKFSVGYDFFYNTAYKEQMRRSEHTEYQNNTAFQMGFNITYHQTFGGFSMLAGPGIYVFDQTDQEELTYFRLGTRFVVKENWIVNTVLHSHGARADHFKVGIGYKLRR